MLLLSTTGVCLTWHAQQVGFWRLLVKRIHIARQYGCRCNVDSFLLNQKGLEEVYILPKICCNMQFARRNMHIVIESVLPLTHTPSDTADGYATPKLGAEAEACFVLKATAFALENLCKFREL